MGGFGSILGLVGRTELWPGCRDAVLPQVCRLCGDGSDESVCAACERMLPRIADGACPSCQLASMQGLRCGRCVRRPPEWDRLLAVWSYGFPLDRLVLSGKYSGDFAVLAWAASRLADRRVALADSAVDRSFSLIPVPLAPERLAARGFNQAVELGRWWVRRWPQDALLPGAVVRARETAVQQELSWTERRANVRGAFAATGSMVGRHVILIDDVLTTGATLNELARVVRRAGAASVSAAVLARVLPPRRSRHTTPFGSLPR